MINNFSHHNTILTTHRTTDTLRELDHLPTIGENRSIHGHSSDDSSRRVLPDMQTLINGFGEHLFREGIASQTSKKYLKDLRQFCREKNITRLDDFTNDSVKDWILTLRRRNLAVGSISGHLWALKGFCKFLETEKKVSPFVWDISIPRVPAPQTVEFLELHEQERLFSLLNYAKVGDVRLRVFFELMINTGMRPSEALNLTRADLASHPQEIEIIGKGRKKRMVYLNERAYQWLDRYCALRNDSNPALFVTQEGKGRIRALTLRTMEGEFHRLIQKSDIKKKIVLHTLRHTFATLRMASGSSPDYIAQWLGHSNIKTTRKYYLAITQKHAKEAFFRSDPFNNGNDYKGLPQQPVVLLSPTNY